MPKPVSYPCFFPSCELTKTCLHRPARMPGWVAQGCWTLAIGGKSITALILLRKRGSKVLVVKVREREFPPVEFII